MITAWLLFGAAAAPPLTLDEVLQAVDQRVPDLVAAQRKLREAEAKLQGSRGAFDPVFGAAVGQWTGEEPGLEYDVTLDAKSLWGPSAKLGWSRSLGSETDELSVIGTVPLLDGLIGSSEAAGVWRARAGVSLADAEQRDKAVQIRLKASESYWKWVAAGEKADIERDLLRQVEERNTALSRQVEQGTRARIDLLDNARAVLQRRDALALAEQDLAVSSLLLSLWYRDETGEPLAPTPTSLPELQTVDAALPTVEADLAAVVERPDIQAFDALVTAATVDRTRARNQVLPTLDLLGEVIQPLGDDAQASLFAGAALELPTLSRKGRGAVAGASAAVERTRALRRGAVDAAKADVLASRVAIDASWRRVEWTREAEALAAEVVTLERRRFQLGSGDLFELLVRESNLASAQKAAVDAAFDHEVAMARRRASLGR